MLLELNERKVKITAVNPNRELHGEDPKPVCYIRLATDLQGDDLAMFHPSLRSLLYTQASAPDLAEQGQDGGTGIRFPNLGLPLKWDDEVVGAEVRIHYGTSEKSHIVLPGCVVNKFSLEPLDGGTVSTTFLVTAHPDEKQMGRLAMMVGAEMPISITPPEPGEESGEGGES